MPAPSPCFRQYPRWGPSPSTIPISVWTSGRSVSFSYRFYNSALDRHSLANSESILPPSERSRRLISWRWWKALKIPTVKAPQEMPVFKKRNTGRVLWTPVFDFVWRELGKRKSRLIRIALMSQDSGCSWNFFSSRPWHLNSIQHWILLLSASIPQGLSSVGKRSIVT